MKKNFVCLLLLTAAALAGCAAKNDGAVPALAAAKAQSAQVESVSGNQMVEVREKLFIAQINDIYTNAQDYVGKTIRYEGVFDFYAYNDTGDMFYSVIRYGPGCCGNDGNVGFEVKWDKPYPAQDDWVRAEGVLEEYEEDGQPYLRLNATKLEVLQERGNPNVTQ